MVNFHMLVKKILKAIRIKYDQNILYGEEQKVGKTGRVYTEYRVGLSVTVGKYNEMHPECRVDPKQYPGGHITIPLKRTIKIQELFFYLMNDIWKPLESGEMYERGKEARKKREERFGSGRAVKHGRRRGGSAGVLQDAQVSEELSGSEAGDKQFVGGEEGEGDIGET